MVGWHHRCDGHEFGQALGVGDGQRGLACCSPWVAKRHDWASELNCALYIYVCIHSYICTQHTRVYTADIHNCVHTHIHTHTYIYIYTYPDVCITHQWNLQWKMFSSSWRFYFIRIAVNFLLEMGFALSHTKSIWPTYISLSQIHCTSQNTCFQNWYSNGFHNILTI